LGQVKVAIQQALKAGSDVAEMHADDAILDLPTTPQPLPGNPDGMRTALGRPRLVETPNGLGVRVFAGDDPLALVAHAVLVPLD
jgi:hypothetical protein